LLISSRYEGNFSIDKSINTSQKHHRFILFYIQNKKYQMIKKKLKKRERKEPYYSSFFRSF